MGKAFGAALAAVLLWGGPALAQAPLLLDLQGFLRTATGQPVNRTVAMTVGVYPSETGTTPSYQESLPAVPVSNGRFAAYLGAVTPLPDGLFEALPQAWVGIRVEGAAELPRQRLVSVPYALVARAAVSAASLDCVSCVGPAALKAGSVGSDQLADGSVTAEKLVGGSLGSALLSDGSITAAKVDFPWAAAVRAGGAAADLQCDACVMGAEVAEASITASHLVPGSVGATQVADFAITSQKIAPGAVGGAQLATGAVTADKLGERCGVGEVLKSTGLSWTCAPDDDSRTYAGQGLSAAGSVVSFDDAWGDARYLNEGQFAGVTTPMIAEGAVTADRLANQSVNGFKLVDGAVWESKLASGAVTSAKISDGAVTPAKMAPCGPNQALVYNGAAWACGDPDPGVGTLTAGLWCKANAAGTAVVCNVTPLTAGPTVYACPKTGLQYCAENTCIGQLSTSSTCNKCSDNDGCSCTTQACTQVGRLVD